MPIDCMPKCHVLTFGFIVVVVFFFLLFIFIDLIFWEEEKFNSLFFLFVNIPIIYILYRETRAKNKQKKNYLHNFTYEIRLKKNSFYPNTHHKCK